MLFKDTDTLEEIWQAVKHELHRGALDAKHPFHWVNLGTVPGEFPSVRTVVLRIVNEDLNFFVYTDYRSEKCSDLQQNPNASLHFYHPKKQVQVRVKTLAKLHFQDDLAKEIWKAIPAHRRSEYTATQAPGTPISSPQEGWNQGDLENHFFCVLELEPLEIEVLQLRREGHLRLMFSKDMDWKGAWLVP
ncbi:pyridoxamine 5'-phosphate oxidase family protein [Algoriphagus marincola]|uniref:Pyridoxamine 5'-phosphate oxidase family protein n=1 Tax=Algoriphagus marincola TaxID=264027 RepID=A0ABS7N6X3_9BACT|nr:pyridoxamine 5'-phosphate oxidase family protein [Algoriphagus marincola]MBY5952063.1 pyridoxamine 5'-phosphate oxidase family protein [Algoriphagus marincola]